MEIRTYEKVHRVKPSDRSAVHIVEKSTLGTMCGRELNWKWELSSVDIRDALSLAQDVYCLNCYKAFDAKPENASVIQ